MFLSAAFFKQPIGKSAVSRFAMRPRTHAQKHGHIELAADSAELFEVAVARKIKRSLHLLMVDPEQIGGNDLNAALLHFLKLSFPILFGNTGKMHFSHAVDIGLSISCEILVCCG